MAKTREELKQALETLTTDLMNTEAAPCTERHDHAGLVGRSCLQREEERTRKKRPGYQNYDPSKMCQHCAAAWHVDCARLIFCFALHNGPISEGM